MGNVTENTCRFLENLCRFELSCLLRVCSAKLVENEVDNGFYVDLVVEAVIEAPSIIDQGLKSLSPEDRKRIAQAIASSYHEHQAPDDIVISSTNLPANSAASEMLAELLIHRQMMIDVATGGERIQDVNDYYRAREIKLRSQFDNSNNYNNPHDDLWSWYHLWSEQLPTYKERRRYIRELFGSLIDFVAQRELLLSEPRAPTGWDRVDRALLKARKQVEKPADEEDCQTVGLLCREVIISLAQAVFDPAIHQSLDGIKISKTDANRMIESYITHTMSGGSQKEVRQHAKASLALALNLQHRRTATPELAALCIEATSSTVAVIAIIAKSVQSHE